MTTWILAPVALACAALVAGQWIVHRALHRRALLALRERHRQQQQNSDRKLEQAKRQVARQRQELAAVRLVLMERRRRVAPPPAAATCVALLRQLDEAPARARLPDDGFADTLPAAAYAHAGELLASHVFS